MPAAHPLITNVVSSPSIMLGSPQEFLALGHGISLGRAAFLGFLILICFFLRWLLNQSSRILSWLGRFKINKNAPSPAPRNLLMSVIAHVLPCKIYYVDAKGMLVFTNQDSYSVFEGTSMKSLLGATRYKEFERYYQNSLRGHTLNVELCGIFIDSQIAHINFIPHRDSSGVVVGVICVSTDVTSYKKIEKELSAAKEAAEIANATKSAFLAHMSHEIRTPLGAVLGFSDLLARPSIMPAERERYLNAIKRNGTLLKSLIDDILDISKVEAGKVTLEICRVNLHEVISDIVNHVGVQATTKKVDIVLDPAPNLPCTIETDPTRLKQILINIVGNAVKFTSKGKVEVRIEEVAGTDLIAFHVKDSGCGILSQHAQDLFKPFSQGDSATKREYGGTGLGLALSRRFARLLGGDVCLTHSVPGEGSVFTITINKALSLTAPLLDPPSPPNRLPDDSPAISDPYALQGIRILLVEDAPDNQLLISTYLKSAGATIEIANNGLEALSMVDRSHFDIVIMDIQMPVMDGYETAEELRMRGFNKPLIALTAHTMIEEREKCLAHGFEAHIGKPINPQALLASVKHHVDMNQNPYPRRESIPNVLIL
ncbi:MAG: response regulator [Chitinophagaceae bacterium]|nr:response regulator [Oligoflexus sp.]